MSMAIKDLTEMTLELLEDKDDSKVGKGCQGY